MQDRNMVTADRCLSIGAITCIMTLSG